MNAILELIDKAITNKKVIDFTYNGYRRKVEPHHYGIFNDKTQLQAYQIAGGSKNRQLGWKNFVISKIENLQLTTNNFIKRKDHHPVGSKFSQIHNCVT